MDLRQLEILQAIAETGSFSACGRKLHVSQSAISRQILLLEDELGEPLFLRIGRRVRMTPAAETLVQLGHRIFQDLGETPWAAMELRFVDPIGLVDREIARVRWRERNSPFVGLPSERGVAEILDHLFALEPRLVAFVAYTQGYESEVRPRVDAARTPAERAEVFVPFMQRNVYYCRMWEDSRFQQRFRVVDVVRRKDNYWFILYERI